MGEIHRRHRRQRVSQTRSTTMNGINIDTTLPTEHQGATTDETDAVNPALPAEQQGTARFKQLNHSRFKQVLLLAALALSSTLNALGLPLGVRNIIFVHGGDQWTGVIAHFFQLLVTRTDADIKGAARAWCTDPLKALVQYGHISCWKVSQVTDMNRLFNNQRKFNDSLYYWDVRNVVDMNGMFNAATSFNQNLSAWDIEKVREMRFMFTSASAFNQNLDSWQVSADTNTNCMFISTRSLEKKPAWY